MKDFEVKTFIEKMGEFGDIWTENQVKDVYGDRSLQDAISDRQAAHAKMADIIGTVLNK